MNRLREGMEHLTTRMEDHASEVVTYYRPGIGRNESVPASFAERIEQEVQNDGSTLYTRRPAFIIRARSLSLNGSLIMPRRGDQITFTEPENNVTSVYEVVKIAWIDNTRFGMSYRIEPVLVEMPERNI